MISALLAILLANWSITPADTRTYTCKVDCFRSVISVAPLSCERLNLAMTIMFYAFDKWGPLASPEVCEVLEEHDLWINQHASTWRDWGRDVSGLYHRDVMALEVSRDLDALAHEVLHAIEYTTMPESQRSEMGWDYVRQKPGTWSRNKTYLRVIEEFESNVKGLDSK